MKENMDALSQRVQDSFLRLSTTAANLNSVSDKLNASISNLESALKKLGLGITSWVPFTSSTSQDGLSYWLEEIGYAKVNGRWGLAIRTRSGHEAIDEDTIEIWPYNEAPRHLRVRAVKKIPELIDKLNKDAAEIAGQVVDRTTEVDFLGSAITAVASEKPETREK
jgi:hypothetical protein